MFKTKSKADIFEILNALFFLIKTGCQWKLLPNDFPKWRTVYEFYRKWISIGFFDRLTRELIPMARDSQEKSSQPTVAVIDSQSVRSGLAQSEKGIDGGKKIKGIKRHLAVDSNGFPLSIVTSRANVHDSKGAIGLAVDVACKYPAIRLLKADNGYRSPLVKNLKEGLNVALECVKSNFGTSEFKPINGRWVVERTFSWLESFRRLNRNYEQFLHTVKGVAMAACAMFMLRFV
ncbi:MAG: IS5 family transposase [Muribaculaceae bacterium]|nr:IS5 family transposase [Muribaculaceae bacterium]